MGTTEKMYLLVVRWPPWVKTKNLENLFLYMPVYVTGYQLNGPSGPGCIAHHFGTVTLCLQKIHKSILKLMSEKLISRQSQSSGERSGPDKLGGAIRT